MFRFLVFATGLLAAVYGQSPVSSCQDLDTQACQLFQTAKPDLCSDPAFSQSTCKRFCGMCPLECLSCPQPVLDPSDCNTTLACGTNMSCMTKHLRASDGHDEYIMTCEKKEICDGLTLGFAFGKRDISDIEEVESDYVNRYQRDVSISCCDTDFCNLPSLTTTTTEIPSTTQVTSSSSCYRDIVFVIDDSGSVGSVNFQYSLNFVSQIVSNINVGPTEGHVAVMAYSSHPQVNWYLNQFTDKADILNAISKIRYIGGTTRTGEALSAVRLQLLDIGKGERPNAENAVIVLTDGQSTDKQDTLHQANLLHAVSRDVISIVVGQGVDKAELNAIATDTNHVFDVRGYYSLQTIIPKLLNLICSA